MIKPCPFCGASQLFFPFTLTLAFWKVGFNVECWKCGARGPSKVTKQRAEDAWNCRAANKDDKKMTITQQQIIALAVEAGFNWPEIQTTTIEQRLERFYALAVAKETQARIKLQKEFMEYQNDMQARGTRLIKEAYQRGVRDERNACLAEIETGIWMDKTTEEVLAEIADAIRARNKPCRFCNGTGERDSGGSQPWGAAIMVECECQQSDDDYQRGVRDEREALKSICEELEQHYSDYAATALLNGDVDLSNAASGEPRACRAMIDAIRARSDK